MNLLLRKILKLSFIAILGVYYFFGKDISLAVLGVIVIILLMLDYGRLKDVEFNNEFCNQFKILLIPEEKTHFLSATYLALGLFFTILFFSRRIAIIAILFTIIGSIVFNLIERNFGRTKILNNSLEGIFSFFFVCLFIGLLLFFSPFSLSWRVIIIGALVATIFRVLPLKFFDNNLVVPVISALTMSLL